MNLTVDDLADYLATNGMGTVAHDIWPGQRPESPDEVLTLMEYPGGAPGYTQSGVVSENPQVQVSTRGRDYEETRKRCQRAWALFSMFVNRNLNGVWYYRIMPQHSVFLAGRDQNGRHIFAFNMSVSKEVEA